MSTSRAPNFAPDQAALYRDVLQLLTEHAVPYAVSGAFALHQHTGIWRDTKDLDLFLSAADVSRALPILAEAGLECEICDPLWLAKAHRGNYFVDLIAGMSNAILRVDASWMQRSHESNLFGVPTHVLAPEELLASKLFVLFRERFDGADILHIIYGTGGKLDWQRILQMVGEHRGLLLSMLMLFRYVYPRATELVPRGIWDLLRAELENGTDPAAVFRGTLLDENMFAIDVREWELPDLLQQSRARKIELIRDLGRAA